MKKTYTIEALREAREGVEKARQVCDENLAADVEGAYRPLVKVGLFSLLYLGARSITSAIMREPFTLPENPQTLLQYVDMVAGSAALMYGGCVGLAMSFVRSDSKEDRKALKEAEGRLQDIVQTI